MPSYFLYSLSLFCCVYTTVVLYLHPLPKTLELVLIISSFFFSPLLALSFVPSIEFFHPPSFVSSTEFCVIECVWRHRPRFVPSTKVIDRVLCLRSSFVSSTEFCVIDRVLCHRPSFVSSTEFCSIDQVLCHRPSFVPSSEFCVIDQFFVSLTEFCAIDWVLCHRPSFVCSTKFCAIDRVLCQCWLMKDRIYDVWNQIAR